MKGVRRVDTLRAGEPVIWGGSDCFTHLLICGPTRSGKSATIIKQQIFQILEAKARGVEVGLSVIEPKGDLADFVVECCEVMGLDYTHIDPTKEHSARFNVMEGNIEDVAEAAVVVLKGLFGRQEAFFATIQELSTRNVTKLLKTLYDDELDISDVLLTLRDEKILKKRVRELREKDPTHDLVHFFENELLGSEKQAQVYRQFILGLRAQLENILSNHNLRKIMTGKSSIDIDTHFETGGVLAVNTALGLLRTSGDAFGQFVTMHLQNGTFRRKGSERSRMPHFLIIDEYSRYMNPDVEIFLSLAAEYKVSATLAIQSLGQLAVESGKLSAQNMKRSILTNCRSKICFGGVSMEDAKEFAEEFGKDKVTLRQSMYEHRLLIPSFFPKSYRDQEAEEFRFDPTDIADGLGRFEYIHKLMVGGVPQKPGVARGEFIPANWQKRRSWEGKWIRLKRLFRRKRVVPAEKPEPILEEIEELIVEPPLELVVEEVPESQATVEPPVQEVATSHEPKEHHAEAPERPNYVIEDEHPDMRTVDPTPLLRKKKPHVKLEDEDFWKS